MKFKLVHKESRRAFFECSKLITIGCNGVIELGDCNLKDDYRAIGWEEKGTNLICISDAHTHIERLVFPAVKIEHKESNEVNYAIADFMHIYGDLTMSIMGGDSDTVMDYEYYLKGLAELNNDKYEGVDE